MKKSLLLVALFAFAFSFQADAQMKIKKFGISWGQDLDRMPGLSAEMLLGKADSRIGQNIQPFLSSLQSTGSSNSFGFCENRNIRASLVLEPQGLKNVELHTSGVLLFGRRDGVYFWGYNDERHSNLNISISGNEIALESVLLKRVPVFGFLGKEFLNLYGGIGSNVGYHYGNDISISYYSHTTSSDRDSSEEPIRFHDYSNVNDGISTRLFAQAGLGITFFRRIEFGFEARYGAGLRHYLSKDTNFTNLHSTAFNLKYVLGNKLSRAERALKRAERAERARCILKEYNNCSW